MREKRPLEVGTMSMNELFGLGRTYHAPPFQRDYSWDEAQWEALWEDIEALESNAMPHYMGSIVLQPKSNGQRAVIDGQQRLATLSLLVLAAIKTLQAKRDEGYENEANEQRINLLFDNYLTAQSVGSLTRKNRLELNHQNNHFYKHYLIQLKEPGKYSRLDRSDGLLNAGLTFFYSRLQSKFQNPKDGCRIGEFISDVVGEGLVFIQILVDDELSAYSVFETLNARGTHLSTTDLLKNYLFSLAAPSEIDLEAMLSRWNALLKTVGEENFANFLRAVWHIEHRAIRQSALYGALRKDVADRRAAMAFIEKLEPFATVYASFDSGNISPWISNKRIRQAQRILNDIRATQYFPVILAASQRFTIPELERLFEILVVFMVRYSVVCGLNPIELEKECDKASSAIWNNEVTKANEVARILKAVYVSDEVFEQAFQTKSVANDRNPIVRYLLFALENDAAGTERAYHDDSGTIEHILPENPSGVWLSDFSDTARLEFLYRLGNLTLLEAGTNREAGNRPYAVKLNLYQNSAYRLSSSIAYTEWTVHQIQKRQEAMAKRAVGIWRLDI